MTLTRAGLAMVEALDGRLDPGWSWADDERYWHGRRRHLLMVSLVERAARRGSRRGHAD